MSRRVEGLVLNINALTYILLTFGLVPKENVILVIERL
jgi:hypothetical protein